MRFWTLHFDNTVTRGMRVYRSSIPPWIFLNVRPKFSTKTPKSKRKSHAEPSWVQFLFFQIDFRQILSIRWRRGEFEVQSICYRTAASLSRTFNAKAIWKKPNCCNFILAGPNCELFKRKFNGNKTDWRNLILSIQNQWLRCRLFLLDWRTASENRIGALE